MQITFHLLFAPTVGVNNPPFNEMALTELLRQFTRKKQHYYLHKTSTREGAAACTPKVGYMLRGSLVGHPIFGNSSTRDPLGKASLTSHSAAASLRHHVLAASLAPSSAPEAPAATLLPPVLDNVV